MARHAAQSPETSAPAAPSAPSAPSASVLRRAAGVVTLTGAALAMAAGGAQAGEISVPHALAGVTGPIANLQVNPLANTGVDPLDNGVGTQVADFPRVGTDMLTGSVTSGSKVGELPANAVGSLLAPLSSGQ
ncbi:hypothetical protein [Streptomyces sp. NPDC090022]|uniref:hypothetical protein n=1 Tax=Streptomyces sp. NPDC090022 TaxID=3365920 RepID=UPI003828F617